MFVIGGSLDHDLVHWKEEECTAVPPNLLWDKLPEHQDNYMASIVLFYIVYRFIWVLHIGIRTRTSSGKCLHNIIT